MGQAIRSGTRGPRHLGLLARLLVLEGTRPRDTAPAPPGREHRVRVAGHEHAGCELGDRSAPGATHGVPSGTPARSRLLGRGAAGVSEEEPGIGGSPSSPASGASDFERVSCVTFVPWIEADVCDARSDSRTMRPSSGCLRWERPWLSPTARSELTPCHHGWSFPEKEGRWTVGLRAVVAWRTAGEVEQRLDLFSRGVTSPLPIPTGAAGRPFRERHALRRIELRQRES